MSAEHRRSSLLRAARTVFCQKGYHAAGVSDIVAEAGVARGTFYNYFESKRAIFQAVLLMLMDEVAGVVVPIRLDADVSETIAAFLVGLTEDERRGLDSELHRVAMVRTPHIGADVSAAFHRLGRRRLVKERRDGPFHARLHICCFCAGPCRVGSRRFSILVHVP